MLQDFRLKVFYTCVLRKNFTKAAKELGISQPAVSNHIFELEKEVGDLLFNREKGEVSLTEKGKILFDYAERILNIYNCANRELIPVKNEECDELRIGATSDAARELLPSLIDYFRKIYPRTETSIIERSKEELENLLDENLIDIAITSKALSKGKISLFATLSINGSFNPMKTYYIVRRDKSSKDKIIESFVQCCKAYK